MPAFCENTKSFAKSIQTQARDLDQILIVFSTSHPWPNGDQSLIFKT